LKQPSGFRTVVQSLLKYGANPYARDIRNIIHYATDPHHGQHTRVAQALDMANMCFDASYNFDSMIHTTVTLKGFVETGAQWV